MTWGIIGALQEEIALLTAAMAVEKTEEHYGSTYFFGTLEGQRIVLVCSSIGTINAALCASVLVREMHAHAVINVGIAGAVAQKLRMLDVVLSTETVYHDRDDIMLKFYPRAHTFPADPKLLALAENACKKFADQFTAYPGRIATGDLFVNDAAVKAAIVAKTDPDCIEMEGAAIGQVCFMLGIPYLVIRSMSDSAEKNADDLYDNFIDRAANHSAEILREMLRLSTEQAQ